MSQRESVSQPLHNRTAFRQINQLLQNYSERFRNTSAASGQCQSEIAWDSSFIGPVEFRCSTLVGLDSLVGLHLVGLDCKWFTAHVGLQLFSAAC